MRIENRGEKNHKCTIPMEIKIANLSDKSESLAARILAASNAAFPIATVATGIPFGIFAAIVKMQSVV